jgi:hypothetical protein
MFRVNECGKMHVMLKDFYLEGISNFLLSQASRNMKTRKKNNIYFYSIAKIESLNFYKTKASPCGPHLD